MISPHTIMKIDDRWVLMYIIVNFYFRVVRGVGEIDIDKPPPQAKPDFLEDGIPYLLLDIRVQDDYDQCHIVTGKGNNSDTIWGRTGTEKDNWSITKILVYEGLEMLYEK